MLCENRGCTGCHDNAKPRTELCPAARARNNETRRQRRQVEGTYDFNASHGVGAAGETVRVDQRRQIRTPGTYRYKAAHGIGIPGSMARVRNLNRSLRRFEREDAEYDRERPGWRDSLMGRLDEVSLGLLGRSTLGSS